MILILCFHLHEIFSPVQKLSGRPEGDKLIAKLEADVTKEREKTLKAIKEIDFCLDYDHLLTVYEPQSGMEVDQIIHTALSKGKILIVSV